MFEYIDSSGNIITYDQITKMAKEGKTSFDAIVKKNGYKPKPGATKVKSGTELLGIDTTTKKVNTVTPEKNKTTVAKKTVIEDKQTSTSSSDQFKSTTSNRYNLWGENLLLANKYRKEPKKEIVGPKQKDYGSFYLPKEKKIGEYLTSTLKTQEAISTFFSVEEEEGKKTLEELYAGIPGLTFEETNTSGGDISNMFDAVKAVYVDPVTGERKESETLQFDIGWLNSTAEERPKLAIKNADILKDFFNKNLKNVNLAKNIGLREESKLLYNKNLNKAITPEFRAEINTKFDDPNLFKPRKEYKVSIAATGQIAQGGTGYTTEIVKPYEDELKAAKKIILANKKIPKDQVNIEAEKLAREMLKTNALNNKKALFAESIIADDRSLNAGLYVGSLLDNEGRVKTQNNLTVKKEVAKNTALIIHGIGKDVVSILQGNYKTEDESRVIANKLESIGITMDTTNTQLITLKNGNTITKGFYDAIIKLQEAEKANNAYYLKIEKEQNDNLEKLSDSKIFLNAAAKNYDLSEKYLANIGLGLSDITVGASYFAAKVLTVTNPISYAGDEISKLIYGEDAQTTSGKLDEWAVGYTKAVGDIRQSYARDVSFEDAFSTAGNFGKFAAQEISQQIPILIAIAATGGAAGAAGVSSSAASTAMIGTFGAGSKMAEMQTQIARGEADYSNSEMWLKSIGFGASEALWERVTTIPILKRGKAHFTNFGADDVLDTSMKTYFKSKTPGFVYDQFLESAGEIGTTVTQNIIDGRPVMENVAHAGFSGFGMGTVMAGVPYTHGLYISAFSDYNSKKEIRDLHLELKDLGKQFELTKKRSEKRAVSKLMDSKQQEINIAIEKQQGKINENLRAKSAQDIINIENEKAKLQNEAKSIVDDKSIADDLKEMLIKDLRTKYKKLNDTKEKALDPNNLMQDKSKFILLETSDTGRYNDLIDQATIKLGKTGVTKKEAIEKEAYELYLSQEIDINIENAGKVEGAVLNAYDTKKEAISAAKANADTEKASNTSQINTINKDKNLSDSEKAKQIKILEDNNKAIDNEFNIISTEINAGADGYKSASGIQVVIKENMLENQRTQIATHEVGHYVFDKIFLNNEKAFIPIANQLLLTTQKLDKKLYDKLIKNTEKDDKGNFKASEVISRFLEAVSSGDISFAEKKNSFLSGLFGSMIQKEFIDQYDFDFKGQTDMFNFVVGLGKKIKSGELTLKDISEASQSKVVKTATELAKTKTYSKLVSGADENVAFSKSSKELKAELEDLEENVADYDPDDFDQQVRNLESKIKKAIEKEKAGVAPVVKKEVTEEDIDKEIIKNEKGSVSSDKVQKIYEEKGVNGAQEIIDLFKPITKKLVNKRMDAPGFDRELLTSEIETGDGGLLYLIRSYKPEKGVPLAAYINKQLPLRAIAASRRVLDKDFSKDVTEEKGLIAEETVSETKEKPKYKNALESNIFSPEILKTAVNKIVTIVRTLKNRIDAPVTLNRTVTPLISEIRDEVGKQLDIDLKTMLGGKKDGVFRKELLRTKRYILENMTTTWLMGKDGQGGIPQAIQKQIDGKWVSYPDWVGQKIDREKTTTDQAGRTSGAELVRRLPNVFNNVPDEVFLGQFIGPDGNPIRGRKESVSKAMAEEGAFDIINADLAEEGPIFEALATNQERLGYEIANNFAAIFSQQSERGNIKFSKALKEAQGVFENLNKNAKFTLIGEDGSTFTNFMQGVKNEGNVEKLFNITYGDNAFEPEDRNKIVNAIKSIYSFYNKQSGKSTAKRYGINLNEDFESFANRKIFNALSKDQSLALTLNIPNSDLQWKSKDDRKAARVHMKNFYTSAIKNFTENKKMSRQEAQKLFTRLFSRAFSYGKDQSLFDNQRGFFNAFLKGTKAFTIGAGEVRGNTIKYKGEKVNLNIGEYSQATSAKDISRFIETGKFSEINIEERKAISAAAKKDLKILITALKDMYLNKQVNYIQLGLIFKSLGGSMNSPLKLASELRYVAEKGNYSNDTKEWVYEHVPPSNYISRIALGVIVGKTNITIDEFMDKLIDNSYVTILPKSFDKSVNELYKSNMPFYYEIGDNPLIRYLDAGFNGKEVPAFYDLYDKKQISGAIVKDAFSSKIIKNTEAAILGANKFSKAPKGISVFDFDDTVGLTKGSVLYTMPGDQPVYHGAPKGKDVTKISDKGVKFFATDIREADEYARIHSGTTQQFVINNSQVVDEEVAINKMKELGLTPKNKEFEIDDAQFYELIDTRFEESLSKPDIIKLFDALKKDGVKALSYSDGAQVSGKSTTSIAVIDTSIISEPKKLNAEEFAKNGSKLLEEGAVFDFSEFSKVVDGKPGPMVEKMKKMIGKFGPENFFILTARPANAAVPIHEFLSSIGIDIPLENITGLGNSTAQAKADWMTAKAAEGYNDFYFADDAPQNVEAVKKALDVPGITSKVQQARLKFSLNSRQDLNWKETGDSKFATFEVKGKEYSLFLTDTGYFNWGDRVEATLNTLINKYDLDEPALLGSYEGETLNLVFSDEDSSTDITGRGNAAEVFGTVINGVIDYANANNTDNFIFTAKEPSRIKLYDAIASTIANKLKWNVFSKNGVYIVSKYPAGRGILPFENQSKAVQDVLNVVDIKSPRQQAKIKFSKTMSDDFNRIIEENKGVESYKVFSDITARRRGLKKNRFDFYVPPSAADFELLLYNFMGKGTLGEEQKKFFQDALITPYINGVNLMDAVRQSIKKDYKALLKSFPEVKKDLEKLTPNKDFTYDQAMRVAIWSQYGTEIPGLSQRDVTYLTDLINNDPELAAFKDGLIVMGRQKDGWLPPGTFWDSDTIISDLYNITEGSGRKKFLAEFIENTENIFGKWEDGRLVGPNMNKVEAVYGTNVREALEDSIYRMINGKNRSFGQDKETTAWSSWVNGSTGAIMFMNTRSAALQMLGAVNFLNWRDNNPFNAGKAFLNQPQYWKDFARIWNSDKLKERRGGLREDVASAEIANAAAGSKNKVVAVTSYLLKIGYTPTQLADSFAIASGGAPFYRNRVNSYMKEGLTEQEAESKAWQDFSKVSDETQQSGDPKDISKQQSSGAGRLLLVFQNFTMQQSRIVKKAVLDLKNGRGDAKTNIAKIAYYLAVQNIMFSTLQQGLFAVMFDDDDDEEKKKKKKTDAAFDVANGVLDSILRGTGFVGGITATLKNTVVKYLEERAKKQKAEYAKVVLEAANMSPPIGSKLRKTYSALQQTKYDKDLIEARGWGVMQDGRVHLGPMYSVTGKLVEVGTNFPMDRLVNKVENVSQAFNSENTAMQRLATGMGYSPWTVGIEGTKGDILIKETAKAKRKEEGILKAKETRRENAERLKDSIEGLSPTERRAYRRKIALEKRERKIQRAKENREEMRKRRKRRMGE